MKYCIFGGTFDPPHQGHLQLAQSARDTLNLDTIFWVPAQDPPLKTKPSAAFSHRAAMVRLAIGDTPYFAVSEIEAKLPSPSFSINTIQALKAEFGRDHDWHFLIGADNWNTICHWHRWEDVLQEVTMIVYPRQGHAVERVDPGVINLALPEVVGESRSLRAVLRAAVLQTAISGQELETVPGVLPAISAYIRSHDLYSKTSLDDAHAH